MNVETNQQKDNAVWAVVELFGHTTVSGRLTKPSEWGGLWQLDIPDGDTFRTEFISTSAIYRARIVSEEIARGYAAPARQIIAYDAPIVTREEHLITVDRAQRENFRLQERLRELERRLTAVNALPEPAHADPDDDLDGEH